MIVIVAFIVSILGTLTMNAMLRFSVEGMAAAIAAWVVGLILWIIQHKRTLREREQLEEELRRETASDV